MLTSGGWLYPSLSMCWMMTASRASLPAPLAAPRWLNKRMQTMPQINNRGSLCLWCALGCSVENECFFTPARHTRASRAVDLLVVIIPAEHHCTGQAFDRRRRRLPPATQPRHPPPMKGAWAEKLQSAVAAVGHSAVAGAKELSKFVAQEALGAQCLLEYTVGPQVASAGAGSAVWRVHTARSKKEGEPEPNLS